MLLFLFFFFNDTATTEIYTLSLHDALPICSVCLFGWSLLVNEHDGQPEVACRIRPHWLRSRLSRTRSEEHTSELQSRLHLVCRLLLEKKKTVTMSAQYDTHPTSYRRPTYGA